jgi:hypothetical protein
MTQREKTLVGAVAAAGLLWFGSKGVASYRDAVSRNDAVKSEAQQLLDEAKLKVVAGQHARRQLRNWESQSLPRRIDAAQSLYQDWLRAQLTGAGLEVTQLVERSGARGNQRFEVVGVDVTATGTLAQLTDFLHRFYSAVHLHRITQATLTRTDNGQKLSVNLTVGAMALPGANREDKLAEGEPRELALPLEEVRTQLVSRNPFAPPSPKAENGPDGEAADTYFSSAATYGPAGWVINLLTKKSGKTQKFNEGDTVEIGQFKGKIIQIELRRVVFSTDKGEMELQIGQPLTEAVVIDGAPAA